MRLLRIWSAGCATGEEPYSLAMMLREMIPDIQDWNISILATDINRQSLAHAAEGVYRQHSFRSETPSHIRERYFIESHNGWALKPAIRQMVHFSYLNLVEDNYPSPTTLTLGQDIIVCRNVTIYFNTQVTRTVVGRFNSALRDDGWLIVGPSEPQVNFYEPLGFKVQNLSGAVLYQKSVPLNNFNEIAPVSFSQPAVAVSATSPTARYTAAPPAPVQPRIESVPVPQTLAPPMVNPIQTHLDAATSCANQMQWENALGHLDSVLKLEPMCSEAYFLRSLIYQHQGDNRAAIDAIKRTLYLDRRFVLGHFNLGMIQWQEGLVAEAQKAWKLAHELVVALPPDTILPQGDGMRAGRLLSVLNGYLNQEAAL
jgi:chemotaxis protein methyltransferase CheR